MVRLFLLYAILIFAKKAPKMITDLLNIKSEGLGLKGLNIKNKMGEAALVGGAVKKGMTDVHGRMRKGAAGFASGLIHGEGSLKDRVKGPDKDENGKRIPGTGGAAFRGMMSGIASGGKEARENGENGIKGLWTKGYRDTRDVARGGQPTGVGRIEGKLNKLNDGVGSYGYASLTNAHSREAENFKKSLDSKYGKDAANKIMAALAVKHGVNGRIRFDQSDEYEAYKKDLKAISEAYSKENVVNILKKGATPVAEGAGGVDGIESQYGDIGGFIEKMDIGRYGTSILMKKDLLTERGKQLDKIKNAYDSYRDLRQSNMDTSQVEEDLRGLFAKAERDGLFADYPGMGVDGVDLSLTTDANGVINSLGNLDNKILENTKKLKGTESDIERMKAVEAEKPGTDKK